MTGRPIDVLFVSEGGGASSSSSGPLGHSAVERALRAGTGREDFVARFRELDPLVGPLWAATRSVPGLRAVDLDLQPLRWYLVQSARMRRLVRQELRQHAADAVHVYTQSASLLMGTLMASLPVYLRVDATFADFRALGVWRENRRHSGLALAPANALERRAFRRAAAVLAFTSWARRGVERACPDARVLELHPGLDLQLFAPAPHRARERPRVLFVGGNFAAKGGHDVLAALEPMLGDEVDLQIVTTSDVRPRRGVEVFVLAPGDAALVDLYQQADIFCLPATADVSPNAVVEAMACGAPVVSARVAGIPDLLGEAGIVVPPREPARLHEALVALLRDGERRAELASRGRERVEQHYDARLQTSRLLELMREDVERPRFSGRRSLSP